MSFILKIAEIIFVILTIYYGVKFFRRKNGRRQGLKRKFLTSLFIFLLVWLLGGQTHNVESSSNDNVKVVKKYIGKDKYRLAKKEHLALLAKKKKLVQQSDKVQDKKDDIVEQKNKEKEAAEQAQKQAQEDAKKQEQTQNQTSNAESNKGDMNTSDTGQIVGNKNSHIYHVPGQRGYSMNSSNAVYFNSEQDAIAAGYRKAKV